MIDLEVTRLTGITLVVPQEDLDASTATEVKRALGGLIEAGQARLVMDLTQVRSIDGAGLGVLVGAGKRARAIGGNLKLCGLREEVRSLFEMTRLSHVMAIHEDQQAAVASW